MRSTVANLRSTLDASEQQVRDVEKKNTDLRRMLDEHRLKFDRVNKDYKAAKEKLEATARGSGRNSMDSASGANGPSAANQDALYLKTILLQFLEQKDNRLRAQLVPVLGKLLKFDK
jgi:hypothetical protein